MKWEEKARLRENDKAEERIGSVTDVEVIHFGITMLFFGIFLFSTRNILEEE